MLSNANSYYPDKRPWNDRIKFVTEKGLAEMVDTNMQQRWFTEGFSRTLPANHRSHARDIRDDKVPGYVACCQAIAAMDFRASNPSIKAPTLVIVGSQDVATPPSGR